MNNAISAELIKSSTLGDDLDLQQCAGLATIMGQQQIKDGETLVVEGTIDPTLFLLVEGGLIVSHKDVDGYRMKPGECAGTRAFIDNTPRQGTLRAVGDTTLYTLNPTDFESLLDKHPRIVYNVMRSIFRITHSNLERMNIEKAQLSNYINKSGGKY